MNRTDPIITYRTLFFDFLKIGATSFGGFMALISVIEKQVVEKRKLVESEELLDAVSVASMLPGPMAVNVVAFLGYRLRGMAGALISIFAVLLPTTALIIILSHFYFKFGNIPQVDDIFQGILPAVCAIIISVALNMAKKNIKEWKLIVICIFSAFVYVIVGGFFVTLMILMVAGIVGWFLFRNSNKDNRQSYSFSFRNFQKVFYENKLFFVAFGLIVFLLIFAPLVIGSQNLIFEAYRKLSLTFGAVSVTLFGGGYVFIPMLQELVVENMQWLTSKEFIDGIALGQITPGPIMISAAFIGFKMAGISGAIVSTIAMFLPPALLMIFVASFVEDFKKSNALNAAFKGIRAAVVGMIFAAAWVIGSSLTMNLVSLSILIGVFILSYFFKWNVVYLIPTSGLLGLILM